MFTKNNTSETAKPGQKSVTFDLHIAREARKKYHIAESQLTIVGDMAFSDFLAARLLTDKINANRDLLHHPEEAVDASELNAVSLMNEIMHAAIATYRLDTNPDLFKKMEHALAEKVGAQEIETVLEAYAELFPPSDDVFTGQCDPKRYVAGDTLGVPHRYKLLEDLLVSWIDNQNPAAARMKEFFDDRPLASASAYDEIIAVLPEFFSKEPRHAHADKSLLKLLLSPIEAHPNSLSDQLDYIQKEWGGWLQSIMARLMGSMDFIREEQRIRYDPQIFGPGPTEAPSFEGAADEPDQFSADLDWMPNVVLIAKNAAVWLTQLSKQYNREITTLGDIPDEALAELARRGFNALWLIGIWQRSPASQRIKQMTGNPEAAASAYSLTAYRMDDSLGGEAGLEALRAKTSARGMRLACDMVPNHMGLDSEWICEHPDWFIQRSSPPFPSYRFDGPDLSGDPRVRIFLEDGYWNRTDAAVVFKRVDPHSGDTRYIYHGNDGTHLPWNDTAQLNYLLPEVREAVIQKIIGIAKQFPIIRFDAAMTLAKKHVQRLWFPEPGSGGDIASRSEYGMSRADFDAAFPSEFWRTVVDRVQQEAPDTLLLAEAFWMMEGYFVRSLGMHRVYNSAFMNMLKNEENGKYRESIRKVLEFEPQILKRYVNFMSNPDEETAIAQFGEDDKYFGCCVLMATMPGTPMFGHGQVEGFGEKYGMEYRRAYHNETANPYLVERHQREIAPLLHKRRIFSEVEHFRLYDLVQEHGGVNENVFAYSNSSGCESGLVVYHNHFSEARGRIHASVPFLDAEGNPTYSTLAASLGITVRAGTYVVFHDHIAHNEYIVESTELAERGLPILLSAFKYHVFLRFREAVSTGERPYAELAAQLAGRGVPSIDIALDEYLHRHVIEALREAIQPAGLRALQCHANREEAHADFVTKLTALSTLIAEAESLPTLPSTTIEAIARQSSASISLPLCPDGDAPVSRPTATEIADTVTPLADWQNTYQLEGWRILLILPFMETLRCIYAQCDDPTLQQNFIRERFLENVLQHVLEAIGVSSDAAHLDIQLIQVLTLIDKHLDTVRPTAPAIYFEHLFSNADVQRFTGVNRYEEHVYFNKERFETLVAWLVLLAIADDLGNGPTTPREPDRRIKDLCALAARCGRTASAAGYQLDAFLKAI